MRQRTADRIGDLTADQQTRIRRARAVRVITGQLQRLTFLPPTVLAAHYPWRDRVSDARLGANRIARAFNHHPTLVDDAETGSGLGVNIRAWMRRHFP